MRAVAPSDAAVTRERANSSIANRKPSKEDPVGDRFVLFSAFLILSAPIAAAADEASLPAGATVLHLAASAERVLPRDEVVAVLRAEATGKVLVDVEAEVNRRMAAALEEAKKSPAIKIETPSTSVYAERSSGSGGSSGRGSTEGIVGWTAVETLRLQSKDFAAALALIGKLEGRQLAVNSVTFTVSPDAVAGVQAPLTSEALERLRARAEAVAADLGLAVDHIKTVTVGNAATPQPQPQPRIAFQAASAMPPPAVEPGEAPVSVVVDADVVLRPKH
jgi:predicted secreted protein